MQNSNKNVLKNEAAPILTQPPFFDTIVHLKSL